MSINEEKLSWNPSAEDYVPVGYACSRCQQRDVLLLQRYLLLEEKNAKIRELQAKVIMLENTVDTLSIMISKFPIAK